MTVATTTWGNGYKVEVVPVGRLKPNPWNPNRENADTFSKVKRSIQANGVVEPPQVRELEDGSLEIINGEHRYRASVELGLQHIPVINLGKVPDDRAKRLTIITNELRGAPEPLLLAALIKDLSEVSSLETLAEDLPMSVMEMDSLLKSQVPFDWDVTDAGLPDAPQREPDSKMKAALGGERKFQIGVQRGNIPAKLSDDLLGEFNRSARAIGSNNVELVMRDWLTRLQTTADDTDLRIVDPPTPPQGTKRARSKS